MLINFHDASIDLDSSSIGFIYRSDKLKQRYCNYLSITFKEM